jgi:DNA end-binding protein Ku
MAKKNRPPARPLWRGHLKLSLVSCPVAVYNAITESEDIHLNFLNPETGNRIKYQVIDAETEDVLDRSDLVRGYQFQKDRYVTVTDEEIDELKIESSSIMNVEEFVPMDDISPVFFERAYYVVPDGEAGLEAFAVIRDAMAKAGVYAVTRAVISRKERVLALRASGKGIAGYGLREATDIRADKDFFSGIESVKADKDALQIATKLVEQKTAAFDPTKFEDRFEARMRALIDAKLKGVELEPEEIPETPNVINLMDALKRSLEGGGGGRAKSAAPREGAREGATVHKLQPKKKAAPKRAAKTSARGRKHTAKHGSRATHYAV